MNDKSLFITFLAILLLFLINFQVKNTVLTLAKNILSLTFILFFPGYLLICLLFKRLEILEVIVLSIGLSISLAILTSMLLHFIRVEITAINILNVLLGLTFILIVGNILKITQREIFLKKPRAEDKNFFFLMILTLAVLVVIIYVSATSHPKEEFTEIYWKISRIENLVNMSKFVCKIANCSISGIPKIGDIVLGNEKFKVIIIDPKEAYNFEYFCIDINRNEVYCEETEGPFKYNDSFLISSNGFSVVEVNEKDLFIINYPRKVNVSDFRVNFVVKSQFKKPVNLNISLFVNDSLKDSKIVSLESRQEITEYFYVHLEEKGEFRVKVAVLPITSNRRIYIDFWVTKD